MTLIEELRTLADGRGGREAAVMREAADALEVSPAPPLRHLDGCGRMADVSPGPWPESAAGS